MKTPSFLKTFCALRMLLLPLLISTAQGVVPGGQSTVTLTLTLSVTSDLPLKTVGANKQYGSTILKTTFNNLFFITQLKTANLLPDNTVTGWQLVLVNRTPLVGDDNEVVRSLYLIKTGKTPVLLPTDFLRVVSYPGYVETFTNLLDPMQKTISGKTTFRTILGVEGKIPGLTNQFSGKGLFSATDKSGPAFINKVPYPFLYQLTSGRLTGVIGTATADNNPDPDRNDYLVEGTVTFSAETAVDITNYPAPGLAL